MIRFVPGFYSGWSLGGNNTANIFGPQVYAGSIKFRTAIWLAAVFVMAGALTEGAKCISTIEGIADLGKVTAIISILVAAVSVHFMSFLKIPVSTSQTIVGSLVGIGLADMTGVNWHRLIAVFASWILTPIGAAVISFVILKITGPVIDRKIKNMLFFNTFIKWASMAIGCYGAYSLGANNLANTTGPYVAAGMMTPFWGCLVGGLGISLGILTYSKNVMETIGKKITPLDPYTAMISVLSVAITLHIYTQIGIPVSSSQAIVGGVVGVGFLRGARMVNSKTLFSIFTGWIFSVAGSALLAYLAYSVYGAVTGT